MRITDAERVAELMTEARSQATERLTALRNMHNLLHRLASKDADESVSATMLERVVDVREAHQHLLDALDAACEATAHLAKATDR
jgi:uncharacterized membrane protein YccC